jgi:predicted Fe-S protein YdhL (DUF1289 family)
LGCKRDTRAFVGWSTDDRAKRQIATAALHARGIRRNGVAVRI